MSGNDRTEWPSSSHLEELRSQGVVFSSPVALRSIKTLGILAGVAFLSHSFVKASGSFLAASAEVRPQSAVQSALVNETFGLLAAPILLGLALAIFSGLLQTRFFFSMSKVSFSIGRLLPFGEGRVRREATLKGLFLLAPLILTVGLISVWCFAPEVLGLLNVDRGSFAARAQSLFTLLAGGVSALTLFFFLGGWLAGWLVFMSGHRMTRKEVEAESREES